MLETTLVFGNRLEISESTLEKAANSMLATLKKELPEEAHVYEICECVIDRCKENLKYKKFNL